MNQCSYCKIKFPKLWQCTRCEKVFYCSTKCQHDDWSKHKQNCHVIIYDPIPVHELVSAPSYNIYKVNGQFML